jgi:hypothetical protein
MAKPDSNESQPLLLPHAAFVVRLGRDFVAAEGTVTGRVEHVASGRAARFSSTAELVEFMRTTLARRAEDAASACGEGGKPAGRPSAAPGRIDS